MTKSHPEDKAPALDLASPPDLASGPGSPRFVSGSTMGHIVSMTSAGAVGLVALFLVDLVDMYFISLLGESALAAAIGFAGTVLFFTTSVSIGVAIATGAMVSQRVGAGDIAGARAAAIDNWLFGGIATSLFAAVVWYYTVDLLALLGATGETLESATSYLRIIIPSMPVLALAMMGGAILRGIGDARIPMYSTLAGGAVNAVLDPIFIFWLDMGIDGAAWASVVARFVVTAVSIGGVVAVHKFVAAPSLSRLWRQVPLIAVIAVPAILTNIATPFGNAYVTWALAPYGDSVMAGWAVIGRIIPVAFGVIFALSGAIGPIYGQNFGAKRFDRVRNAFRDGLVFTTVFVGVVTILLFMVQDLVVEAFSLGGEGAVLVALFCTWLAPSFAFNGFLFVTNAAFNNLGRPKLATLFNWGRASLGTIPFVYAGAALGGASGLLIGYFAGSVVFGLGAMWMGFRVIRQLSEAHTPPDDPKSEVCLNPRRPLWPFSSRRI